MSEHTATIRWQQGTGEFLKGRYSRAHTWTFDGGLTVPGSPSPAVVRPPYSDPAAIDPEEAFVASLSSCHMLTFLHLASKAGFEVVRYEDEALGKLAKNEGGVPWVSTVLLRPTVVYGPRLPKPSEERDLHERAHQGCFIANSVKTEISVQPRQPNLPT